MKDGHPVVIGTETETRPDMEPEEGQVEARNPAPAAPGGAGEALDALQGLQADTEGQETEPEAQDVPSLSLVKSITVGMRDGRRVVYGPSLGVKPDGRTTFARIEKRLCNEIARDRGYESFEAAPGILREEIAGYVRLSIINSLVWAGFLSGERLPLQEFRDNEQAKTRKAAHIGLTRELRDAKVLDLRSYLAENYGARDGEGATPVGPVDPPSSPAEAAEGVETAQEAEEP